MVEPNVKVMLDKGLSVGRVILPTEGIPTTVQQNFVDPVVSSASRLSFLLEGKVYKKLNQMLKDEIIISVAEPTEWVSRMLEVGK